MKVNENFKVASLLLANFPTGGSIGTSNATVDKFSTFLIPQTTPGQTLTIPSPTDTTFSDRIVLINTGLRSFTVLNTVINPSFGINLSWTGTNYSVIKDNSDWGILGNTGTIQATNFVGTTDNVGLSLRTNGTIRQTITNTGNVGIENINPTARFQVDNLLGASSNAALFKNGNGSGGYAVRGESINTGGALGVYGELGVWDGTRWSGVRGNSSISTSPSITGINTILNGVSGYFDQNVGVGNTLPQAKLSLRGIDQTVVLAAARNFPATLHLDNPDDTIGAQQNILFTASYGGVNNPNKVAVGSVGTIREVNGTNADYGQSSLVFRTSGNTIASLNTEKMRITGIGNIGIGNINPTSNIHINGSEAGSITNVTATTTLNTTHHKILVSNGATAITITFPDALTCLGREYILSRAAGSTGSITLQRTGTNLIQALNGTTGATTSIGLHSANGGGLKHSFTAINIAGIGFWVRI